MKPLLLDTNAFAMVLTDDHRLPGEARNAISNAARTSVSAISFYEIGQKVRLGKWDAMAKFAPDLVDIAIADGFDLIALSPDHGVQASLLAWTHRDPFDRMIAVIAMNEEALLVSSDEAFDELESVKRIWA